MTPEIQRERLQRFWKRILLQLGVPQIFRHARRHVVNADDVKLLVRKSPGLVSHFYNLCVQSLKLNIG